MSLPPGTIGYRGVRRLGIEDGWISRSLGLALAPHKAADVLGRGDRERLAQVVGAGLLLSRRPSPWMLARTLLNLVIGGVYAGILSAGTRERGRAIGGGCLMVALTANDYHLSGRLREIEAPYNPTATEGHRP